MSFSSLSFIFYFLPIVMAAYLITPNRWKKLVLLLESFIFYGWNHIYMAAILGAFILFHFLVVFLIQEYKFKYVAYSCAVADVLLLFILKVSKIAFPGISFIIFTMVAFLLDLQWKKEKRIQFWDFALSIAFFPKLLSGPITNVTQIKEDICKMEQESGGRRIVSMERGIGVFILGLSYKVLLADHLAGLWNQIQTIGFESISTPLAWMGAFGYSLEIYFDFQGYSLMAIGIAAMFGFHLPTNFSFPYIAKSVSEFYRRWHMTLGNWFKEYLYIPMGGNRVPIPRMVLNLGVVWLATGLWHGIGFHFVLWGLFLFAMICLEKFVLLKYLEKAKVVSHIYLVFFIVLSWMIFAIPTLKDLGIYYVRMFSPLFGAKGIAVNTKDYLVYARTYGIFLGIGCIFALPLCENFILKHFKKWYVVLLLLVLFWYCIYEIVNGQNNPFLYFQF